MKIAFMHFYTLRMRRGIETVVLYLADALATKGADVSIICARGSFEAPIKLHPNIQIREIPTFRYYEAKTSVPFFLADLLTQRYDIVNIFFADFGEGQAVAWASRWLSFKLNLYICYPYAAAPHRYTAFEAHGLHQRADRLLAHSSYVASDVMLAYQRPVTVLPAGTDPNRYQPNRSQRQQLRSQLGVGDDDVVLLGVSSLEERKGVQRVLQALPVVCKHIPELRYLIVGDGPLRTKLEQVAIDLGVADHVQFIGVTPDPIPFYNAADIFILLSEYEANSVASIEAMSCALPIIAGNTGGFIEVVEPSMGRLVDVHDSQAVEMAILELAQDAMLRRQLGNCGRQAVLEKHSWAHIADRALAIFQEELGCNNGSIQ